ncbi:MAG TPA: NAD(P)/FAD-dependent oxidoreductase [Trueperaceae bacterium]|nr:NAD(P)/FAD-dependent oxidoreductase [Trueperaceae bacterium]
MPGHDVIVVGGGFAGASLALALARGGVAVLVLEREREFRDRVRGELVYPWGVAEGRRLGLLEHVAPAVTRVEAWTTTIAPLPARRRELRASTPSGEPVLSFHHPEVQELLLSAAAAAGAEVLRGATVTSMEPGPEPVVVAREGQARRERRHEARLVVGADGRDSVVRRAAGFAVEREREALVLAGALLEGAGVPADSAYVFMRPTGGELGMAVPVGRGRHRVYAGYHVAAGRRNLSGSAALEQFVATAVAAGTPAGWFDGARLAGPLAEFPGADVWAPSPYRDGVTLVGDAAATSDPNWGCGLALAWRDARTLAEAVLGGDDPVTAARAYARRHDGYYGSLRRQTGWLTTLFRTPGPEADALRERALPLFVADPTRAPDVVGLGPDGPSDERARRRFFGEE